MPDGQAHREQAERARRLSVMVNDQQSTAILMAIASEHEAKAVEAESGNDGETASKS